MNLIQRSAVAFALLLAVSCGGTTGGELLNLPFQVGGVQRDASQSGSAFVVQSPTGWTVSLSHALIAVGPFYFNVANPSTDSFRSGVVIMQSTQQVIVDPLDPTLYPVPSGANGETGTAVSVEVDLFPPDGTADPADTCLLASPADNPLLAACPSDDVTTADSQAWVEGWATNGTTTIPFNGWIVVDQAFASSENKQLPYLQRVAGANANLVFASNQQVLQMRIDPTHWFDQTDFGKAFATPSLGPGYSKLPSGEFTWSSSTSFFSQLFSGITTSDGVYLFTLTQ